MVLVNSVAIPTVNNTAVVGTGTGFTTLAYNATSGTSNLVSRNSSGNSYFNSSISGYATTATAAGTTTLTVASAQQQYFTGTTTQTVTMPVRSTLVLGQTYTIVNRSTGIVTVQSSGANLIQAMATNTQLVLTVITLAGTGAQGWSSLYSNSQETIYSADTGTPFSISAVTIRTNLATRTCGSTISFDAASPNITLQVTDVLGNTCIGQGCGDPTSTGSNNTCYGVGSFTFGSGGSDNVGIGAQTLNATSNSFRCVAVGAFALDSAVQENDITAIGYNSLSTLNAGNGFNVGVGSGSLSNLLSGARNLSLGSNSGTSLTGSESDCILLNSAGTTGRSNSFAVGSGTGTGSNQLTTAFISGVANPTLVAGSPTPYLTSQDISNDQLQCLTPVAASAASATFGQLAVGTALQNTANYPILVNVSIAITASTTAVILVGVGPTNTPTAQAVTASFTVAAATTYGFSFVVPAKYYAQVTTTGTITVGSITTFVSQIG